MFLINILCMHVFMSVFVCMLIFSHSFVSNDWNMRFMFILNGSEVLVCQCMRATAHYIGSHLKFVYSCVAYFTTASLNIQSKQVSNVVASSMSTCALCRLLLKKFSLRSTSELFQWFKNNINFTSKTKISVFWRKCLK